MTIRAIAIALAFMLVMPLSAVAGHAGGGGGGHGGGGGAAGGGGGGARGGGAGGGGSRSDVGGMPGASVARPAGGAGFNLGRDTGVMAHPAAAPQPAAPRYDPASTPSYGRPSAQRIGSPGGAPTERYTPADGSVPAERSVPVPPPAGRTGSSGAHDAAGHDDRTATPGMVNNRTAVSGVYQSTGHFRAPPSGGGAPHSPRGGWPHAHASGYALRNPRYNGSAWGWNGGHRWDGYSDYWGDGFWGPFALGSLMGAYIAGSDSEPPPYYQVAADSPGAQLLANYDLTQTPCGAPNLVVLYGPDYGTICAYPNGEVSPGSYNIDEPSLSLTSN